MVDERLGLFRLPLEARRETDHLLLESMDYLYHFLATNSPDLRQCQAVLQANFYLA